MNPWTTAKHHCLEVISTATALNRVINTLADANIPIATVQAITSTIKPSIMITPFHAADARELRELTGFISDTLGKSLSFKPIAFGTHWLLRATYHSTEPGTVNTPIDIDISTTIPTSIPTSFPA